MTSQRTVRCGFWVNRDFGVGMAGEVNLRQARGGMFVSFSLGRAIVYLSGFIGDVVWLLWGGWWWYV